MALLASKYSRFFFSLARLIEDSARQLISASYDSLEFLVWHLGENERTLATLTSRFCETYGCLHAQQNTVTDLSHLCNRVAFLHSHLKRSLDCDDNSVVVSTPGNIRPLQFVASLFKDSHSACLTKGGSSHFCTEECSENYSKSLQCSLSQLIVVSTKEACRATL